MWRTLLFNTFTEPTGYILLSNSLIQFSSDQFSHSVVSHTLQPYRLQHARLPRPHQFLEFTQTHVHWVGDAIQPTHPVSSSSPPTFNLSQHQSLFQWFTLENFFTSGGHNIGVSASASALPMSIQDWSPLGGTSRIALQSKGPSRVFSNTTVQKHQFLGAQLSL